MQRSLPIVLAAAAFAAIPLVAAADTPFGGDDAGCLPVGLNDECETRAAKLIPKFVTQVTACHIKQARAALPPFDEDGCEAKARTKFDVAAGVLASKGICPPLALPRARALVTGLVSGQTNPLSLDAINGAVYCDTTSATPIDPSGDDAGYVPGTGQKCSEGVWKNLAKIVKSVVPNCHAKTLLEGLDDEACEMAVLDKYTTAVARLHDCPACLDATATQTLATDLVNELDDTNALLFGCSVAASQTLYFHHGASPVTVPGGTTQLFLDATAPTATTPTVEQVLVSRGASNSFAAFTGTAFTTDTTLDPIAVVTLNLNSNQKMKACADVTVAVEHVDSGGGTTALGSASLAGQTIKQGKSGGTKGFTPLEVTVPLSGDLTIHTGESVGVGVTVKNTCTLSHGIRLDYDATVAQTRIDLFPASVFAPF